MFLYAYSVFLSAFLLFEVQPVIAKVILPWFGGSSAVWSSCMLFFQLVLLGGYVYAHWLYNRVPRRIQAWLHCVLLLASLAAVPILPNPQWRMAQAGDPSLRILLLLLATIGLPYFLLSSTSPLLQAWYASNHRRAMPYRLFALSNLASMLALLTYPILVEPNLTVRFQATLWSWVYSGFTVLCSVTAWRGVGVLSAPRAALTDQRSANTSPDSSPNSFDRVMGATFAACAAILLLAVTNHLTQDVAAIPFLWILPLSAYLLTFILCFEAPGIYRRTIFLPLAALALGFMAYSLNPYRRQMEIRTLIILLVASLFICSMACHGEVVRRRPPAGHLTSFYVSISLGGALGGIFVNLLAPHLFNGYYEFHLGLALCASLLTMPLWKAAKRWTTAGRWLIRGSLAAVLCGYLVALAVILQQSIKPYRYLSRNFYAQLRVRDEGDPRVDVDANRRLIHGTINHGEQMLRSEYRRLPVSYFCPQSGIGRAMTTLEERLPAKPRRIGILGLGCGTLAAYGRPGDTLRIYEINPQVVEIARSQFTYLKDSLARAEIEVGDGRLVLETEPSQQFDVLVMDAFSGDSVPVHLITKEAFHEYFRHMKPDGIVAVNVTNHYLDLRPVIAAAAAAFGKVALLYQYHPDEDNFLCFDCAWVLIMDPSAASALPRLERAGDPLRPRPKFRLWTDDFSNLFQIIK